MGIVAAWEWGEKRRESTIYDDAYHLVNAGMV